MYENQVFSVTIESDSSLSKVDRIGISVPGFTCFWVPLFEKSRMEWAVEKLTEFEVGAIALYIIVTIVLIILSRLKRYLKKIRLDRFVKKIWSAAQQSGNLSPPKIVGVYSISELKKDHFTDRTYGWTVAGKQIIHVNEIPFLEGSEDRHEIKNLLDDRLTHFVIGPEGDFSDSEIKFLSNIKWGCMNRSTILREVKQHC